MSDNHISPRLEIGAVKVDSNPFEKDIASKEIHSNKEPVAFYISALNDLDGLQKDGPGGPSEALSAAGVDPGEFISPFTLGPEILSLLINLYADE